MLIWVLQSSQCSKILLAQHWGRRGADLSESKSEKSECKKFLKKIHEEQALFQRFVTSIYVMRSKKNFVEPLERYTGKQ